MCAKGFPLVLATANFTLRSAEDCRNLQVNWQMLWADQRKRYTMSLLGYLVLAFAVLFPVGIFTGEHLSMTDVTVHLMLSTSIKLDGFCDTIMQSPYAHQQIACLLKPHDHCSLAL